MFRSTWVGGVATVLLVSGSACAEPAAELAPGQLEAASRVLTGQMACEFGQSVQLAPIAGKPGHFALTFKKNNYTLVVQETSTGAVRLEDRQAGVVWLQIPTKSMLLNARIGERMVDDCHHEGQRSVIVAADSSLGIADGSGAPASLAGLPTQPAAGAHCSPCRGSATCLEVDCLSACRPIGLRDLLAATESAAERPGPTPWPGCPGAPLLRP